MPPPIPPKPSLDGSIYSNYPGTRTSAPELRGSVRRDIPPLRHSAPEISELYDNLSTCEPADDIEYDAIATPSTPPSSGRKKSVDEQFVYDAYLNPGQHSIISHSVLEDKDPVLSYDVFFDGQKVFGLDDDNFHAFVKFKDLAMIMFYDPLDSNTDEPKENFKKAARYQDSDQFAAVDCNRYSDLCRSLDIKVMPMFRIYSFGKVLGAIRETSMFDDKSMIQHLDTLNDTLVTTSKRSSNVPKLPATKSKCSLARIFGFKK